jgi:Ribonuclease G/E
MAAEELNAALFVSAGPGEWRAAWAEDGEPVELYVERGDTKPPGSRHLGRVVRVVRALDAALVDIGDARPGFLPLRDMPEGVAAVEGARLVVEVRREAWQDKAPRLTAKVPATDAAHLDPPVQLFPAASLAAALALRVPAAPHRVTTDDAAILAELRGVFPRVEIAHRGASNWPFDLDAVFETALSPSLVLDSGGTVHFEETRTATLIDVDTGTPAGGSNARAVRAANLAAARLIAQQLRLRSIGGPVVIDFVGFGRDAARRGHKDAVRQALETALAGDLAKPQLLGWTRLGHLELMRPRRGRSLGDALLAPASRAKQSIALAHEALRRLQREARANPAANWQLSLSAEMAAALRGPAAAALKALETRLGRGIVLETVDALDGFDIRPL